MSVESWVALVALSHYERQRAVGCVDFSLDYPQCSEAKATRQKMAINLPSEAQMSNIMNT